MRHQFLSTLATWLCAMIKGIVHPKKKILASLCTLMSIQTHMAYFLKWNTKGDISKNVLAALFHAFKMDRWEAFKLQTRRNDVKADLSATFQVFIGHTIAWFEEHTEI